MAGAASPACWSGVCSSLSCRCVCMSSLPGQVCRVSLTNSQMLPRGWWTLWMVSGVLSPKQLQASGCRLPLPFASSFSSGVRMVFNCGGGPGASWGTGAPCLL